MGALTPTQRLFVPLRGVARELWFVIRRWATMNTVWSCAGLPASQHRIFRPSCLQPPPAVPEACLSLVPPDLPRADAWRRDTPITWALSVIWASPPTRGARHGRRPNRVR